MHCYYSLCPSFVYLIVPPTLTLKVGSTLQNSQLIIKMLMLTRC